MANMVGLENGLEVPIADGFGSMATAKMMLVKPSVVSSLKMTKTVEVELPEWDTLTTRKGSNKLIEGFRRAFNKDDAIYTDPIVLEGLRLFIELETEISLDPETLVWDPKPKKSVRWSDDVDVGRCKPGPLKSYVEYDPAVSGI